MEQCYDCGKPCGKRHTIGWMNNHDFLCDSCARKRQSNAVKAFGGFMFLFFAVALSIGVSIGVFKPMAMSSGFDAVRSASIGLGVGGIVLFFILRFVAGKTSGCLFRLVVKLVGFVAYALGIGLLFLTFLLEDQFKSLVGLEDAADKAATEEVMPQ